MTGVRSAAEAIISGRRLSVRRPRAKVLVELANKIDAPQGMVPPDPMLVAEAVRVLLPRLREGEVKIEPKLLKLAAIALWDEHHRLAGKPSVVEPYLGAVEASLSLGPTRAVARAYLHAYPDSWRCKPVTAFLARSTPRMTRGWLATASDRGLFDGDRSIAALAQLSVTASQPDLSLSEAGLGGALATSGYAEAIFCVACALAGAAEDIETYERLAALAVIQNGAAASLRHGSAGARNAYAKALLGPYQARDPSKQLQRWLQRQALERFGDPRTHPQAWVDIDERFVRVLRRWLTAASLEQFLDLAGRYAEKHMWQYRRPFWMSYFEAGAIGEAWVYFGRHAYDDARRASHHNEDLKDSYGFLDGADATQSVLILKLGDVTVAEWTHNGQVWLWRGTRGAPPLFRQKIHSSQCRDPSGQTFGKRHAGAENYRWQEAVATKLEHYGIPRTAAKAWKPN